MRYALLITLIAATASYADFNIQEAINNASSGDTITIPAGIYTQPVTITKKITLTGTGTILEIEANQPAILVKTSQPVSLKNLEIQWKTKTKPQKGESPFAVYTTAGDLLVENCVFKALGNPDESPCAAVVMGKGTMNLKKCRFDGFKFTIQFGNGAKGTVEDCMVMNSGHCGITIGEGSEVSLEKNIVTGSLFHGIRCTGGTITADSNLVAGNKSCGFYLGNKSAIGRLSNNLIVDNRTGIAVFAYSKLELENNVILRASDAGLSIIDTATLAINGNVISGNGKGFFGFSNEKGKETAIELNGKNIVYGNTVTAEHIKLSPRTLQIDPQFTAPESGLFETRAGEAKGIGLLNSADLQTLWKEWKTATAR